MNTWERIENKMTDLNDLHQRMDKTRDHLYLEPYELKKIDGKTKEDNVINVRPNKAKTFARSVIEGLMASKWQTVIEGKLTDRQAHVIENFIGDNLSQADEWLLRRFGIPSLFNVLCNHVCARGLIGAQWLSLIENGLYKIDCLPVDMRWTAFEFGTNGWKWVAPIRWRSKAELQEEYAKEIKDQSVSLQGEGDLELRDWWDAETHEVWIEKKLVRKHKNPLGYPPFVIVIPPSGFMLRDKGYWKYEGEDILSLNCDLYDELARAISIEQTLGMDILRPPYEQEKKNKAELFDAPPKTGQTTVVREGERHLLLPRGDMNIASRMAREDILQMIEEGGETSPRTYNTPPSALEVATEQELLDQRYNSRRKALAVFQEQLARMMIDQTLKTAKGNKVSELLIGKIGRKQSYSIGQLGDPETYSITCNLKGKSKRLEIANLAEFSAIYGKLPLRYNLTNILEAEDPDGIMRELELEQARKADPAIGLFEMALRYAEEAEELEDEIEADAKKYQSMMLTDRGVAIIKERLTPAPLPERARVPEVEQEKGSQALMPLLGQGGVPALLKGRGGGTKEQIGEKIR